MLAGRRVLIVLDNARDAAQVRPLLPGSPGCLVVVTSRASLAGLAAAEGARPLRLGPLDDEQAVRLLAARLGPERVAAEPEAVTELVARCGHLPLALAVMAARAAADPGLPLAVLAGQLAGAAGAEAAAAGHAAARGGPGAAGGAGDRGPGDQPARAAVLVTPPAQPAGGSDVRAAGGALRARHHGPGRGQPGRRSPRARRGRALAELAEASLAAEHRPGRYVMHDLVRGYAAGLARAGPRRGRDPGGDRAQPGPLPAHRAYLVRHPAGVSRSRRPRRACCPSSWPARRGCRTGPGPSTRSLLQATAQAAAAGLLTRAWQIFAGQAWFLGGQGYWADFRAVAEAVLAAAEAAGDQVALGWTHATIGRYGTFIGADNEDRAPVRLDHFRRAGDLSGQAWAHLFASLAYTCDGRLGRGGHALPGRPWRCSGRPATRPGRGGPWPASGNGHARLGNYELARGYARQALEAGPGDRRPHLAGQAWSALGFVHSRLGEHRQAISCYRQALALVRERKNPLARWMLASLLAEFGDACQAAGDLPAAVEAWQQALQILDDLGPGRTSWEFAPGSAGQRTQPTERAGLTVNLARRGFLAGAAG